MCFLNDSILSVFAFNGRKNKHNRVFNKVDKVMSFLRQLYGNELVSVQFRQHKRSFFVLSLFTSPSAC